MVQFTGAWPYCNSIWHCQNRSSIKWDGTEKSVLYIAGQDALASVSWLSTYCQEARKRKEANIKHTHTHTPLTPAGGSGGGRQNLL